MFRRQGDILRDLRGLYVSCNLLGAGVGAYNDYKNMRGMNITFAKVY
jgi:hypothetical protein